MRDGNDDATSERGIVKGKVLSVHDNVVVLDVGTIRIHCEFEKIENWKLIIKPIYPNHFVEISGIPYSAESHSKLNFVKCVYERPGVYSTEEFISEIASYGEDAGTKIEERPLLREFIYDAFAAVGIIGAIILYFCRNFLFKPRSQKSNTWVRLKKNYLEPQFKSTARGIKLNSDNSQNPEKKK